MIGDINKMNPEKIVDKLNRWLDKDRVGLEELFLHNRVFINQELASDDNIVCQFDKDNLYHELGVLGVINSLLGGKIRVCAAISSSGIIEEFRIINSE